ncbi:MAG: SDR family NAD(P)-dependent oxidoreductase [Flavitalea sp.]
MDKLLTDKITFVADGTGAIGVGIVRAFLLEDATVIVPSKSARELTWLKEYVADIECGKLVTLLADYPDYDKAADIAENVEAQYGRIDFAVSVFDTPAASPCLTELDITDWQKMTDQNITASFICGHVFLRIMKERRHGMYISISNTDDLEKKSWAALANIAATMQVEMARAFFEEVKQYGVRYIHLFVNNVATRQKHSRFVNKEGWITPEMIGDYITQLYNKNPDNTDNLFHWLLGKPVVVDNINIKQAIR